MKSRLVGLTAVLMLGLSMPLAAQKVTTDFDKHAPFAMFKTYGWKLGTPAKNPLMDERIINAIDAQLAAKGFMKMDLEKNPDLLVVYHAAVDIETQITTFDSGGGWYGWYGPYYGGGTSTTYVDKIPVGTLRVDIADIKNKRLIWQGKATDSLSDKPEKVEKTIQKSAEKMFKKFPPQVKK